MLILGQLYVFSNIFSQALTHFPNVLTGYVTEQKFFLFVFYIFIYLFDRDTQREGTQAGEVGEGEAGFLLSKESNVGLYRRTLWSWPEPKADT